MIHLLIDDKNTILKARVCCALTKAAATVKIREVHWFPLADSAINFYFLSISQKKQRRSKSAPAAVSDGLDTLQSAFGQKGS